MRRMVATGPGTAQIDEHFVKGWVELGYASLDEYLAKHAAFDQYIIKKEQDEQRTETRPQDVPRGRRPRTPRSGDGS